MPELIYEAVKRMRTERGWSTAELAARTVITGVDIGIGAKTIEALEKNPGRLPEARTIECLARAFGVEPDAFYEWPIAVAQRGAGSTREAIRKREADALRKRAQRASVRQPDARDTKPAPRRRKDQGR